MGYYAVSGVVVGNDAVQCDVGEGVQCVVGRVVQRVVGDADVINGVYLVQCVAVGYYAVGRVVGIAVQRVVGEGV